MTGVEVTSEELTSRWLVGPSVTTPPAAAAATALARPLFLVGAHGGAGVSMLVRLAAAAGSTWVDVGRGWPAAGASGRVLVVARTSTTGLEAAQEFAGAVEAGRTPVDGRGLSLEGLVLVADAPGRLPRPLKLLRRLVDAAYPRSWDVGWCETCRQTGRVQPVTCQAAVPVLADINSRLEVSGGEPVGERGGGTPSSAGLPVTHVGRRPQGPDGSRGPRTADQGGVR